MKGILPNKAGWFHLEDTTVPVRNELKKLKVGEVAFPELSDEMKTQTIANIEASANGLLRALNGETRPDYKIHELARNVLNEGTFGSIFSTAIEVFMMNYIRPQLIVSNYLARTIPVGPTLNRTMIAMVRGFGMAKISEVPRYGTYPTLQPSLNDYANQISFDTRKFGVKLEIDKDLANSDEWGVLGFLMTGIADAFRYRKEEEVIRMINSMGKVLYDNSTPTNGVFGVTTSGRGITGAHNGTVSLSDLTRCMQYASMRGMDIGFMLIHPFVVFEMFGDSELRNILGTATMAGRVPTDALQYGFGQPLGEDYAIRMRTYGADNVSGTPGNIPQWGDTVGAGALNGIDPYSTGISTTQAYMAMRANLPGSNITVLVTPQVPIRRAAVGGISKFITNIYLVARQQPVGVLQESNPGVLEWEDVEKEVSMMAFREKYAVIPLHQGRGVFVLKNVVIDRNYGDPIRQYTVAANAEPGATGITP